MLLDPGLWTLAALALAVLLDALVGEPARLYAAVPHPVVLIGRLIEALERHLLREDHTPRRKRLAGVALVILTVSVAVAVGLALHTVAHALPWGWLLEGMLMSTLLAWRSLAQHVRAVADGLARSLGEGRREVAMIVGRDPESLDEHGVARAAIESLAENLSDGVAAPLLWAALLGLPGMLAYKAINTLDSMVGHKSDRYRHFGWASARLDDLANLAPARATGLSIVVAASLGTSDARAAWRAMRRDAPGHRSPNAGWPEAAMAGALKLRLAGPRRYGGVVVKDAWMGDGRAAATADDIDHALGLAARAWLVVIALVGLSAGLVLALSRPA